MRASWSIFVSLAVLASAALGLSCSSHRVPAARASTPAIAARPEPAAVVFGSVEIDAALSAEWTKNAVTPAAAADDARWLRRVHIDIVGSIPPWTVTRDFLSDASPDKRRRFVDSLLASGKYADYWASYWDDLLMGDKARGGAIDRDAFRAWLHGCFEKNAPYNEIVRDLVGASGRNSEGGPRYTRGGNPEESTAASPKAENVSAPVNFFLRFDTPQDLAGTTSRLFLGVQIQCAQCHDHKTEAWKQADFEKFAASFVRTRVEPVDVGNTMGLIRRVDVRDLGKPLPRYVNNPDTKSITQRPPTTLDGKDLSREPSPRAALAAWMVSRENPWFARAIVNRMWGHFLGRGFVNPIDDFRASNPPTLEPVLSQLADAFVASGYDMKQLIRTITLTQAYGLSPGTNASDALWAHFRMVPLGPRELVNSLLTATNLETALRQNSKVDVDAVRAQLLRQYAFLFDVDEEFDHTAYEGTISQALTLLNGSLVGTGTSAMPGGALAEILRSVSTDTERIDALYMRTLSRKATPWEKGYWGNFVRNVAAGTWNPADAPASGLGSIDSKVGKGRDPLARVEARAATKRTDLQTQAFEDIFWALLNSSEFLLNH